MQTLPRSLTWISSASAAETAPQSRGFADLVAKVKPAVISVRVRYEGVDQSSNLNRDDDSATPFQNSPLEKFFGQRFGFENMPNGRQFGMPRPRMAAEGSGFFISADGYAVTNNHV